MNEEESSTRPRAKFTFKHLQNPVLGLEEVYCNFQSYFESKAKGEGHECHDLSHLLSLYENWHSKLYPYCSFDEFIGKLERMWNDKEFKLEMTKFQDRSFRENVKEK